MKAIEARKIADAAGASTLKEIRKCIEKAAIKGECSVMVSIKPTEATIQTLREDGYKVDDISFFATVYEISW